MVIEQYKWAWYVEDVSTKGQTNTKDFFFFCCVLCVEKEWKCEFKTRANHTHRRIFYNQSEFSKWFDSGKESESLGKLFENDIKAWPRIEYMNWMH